MNYNIFMVPLLRVSHKKGVKIENNYVILNTMLWENWISEIAPRSSGKLHKWCQTKWQVLNTDHMVPTLRQTSKDWS